MELGEPLQNININPEFQKNLNDLKIKLETILNIKQKNNELIAIIKEIKNLSIWINKFLISKKTLTDIEQKKKEIIKIKEDIKIYLNNEEEIKNLIEIIQLFQDSRVLIDLFVFEPHENDDEEKENTNISNLQISGLFNPFDTQDEEKYFNFYPKIDDGKNDSKESSFQINIKKDNNKTLYNETKINLKIIFSK